jgi:hypothetical protein
MFARVLCAHGQPDCIETFCNGILAIGAQPGCCLQEVFELDCPSLAAVRAPDPDKLAAATGVHKLNVVFRAM